MRDEQPPEEYIKENGLLTDKGSLLKGSGSNRISLVSQHITNTRFIKCLNRVSSYIRVLIKATALPEYSALMVKHPENNGETGTVS